MLRVFILFAALLLVSGDQFDQNVLLQTSKADGGASRSGLDTSNALSSDQMKQASGNQQENMMEQQKTLVSWRFRHHVEQTIPQGKDFHHPKGKYVAILIGWTHTRDYHKGFLRNHNGDQWSNAKAIVKGLKPGKLYEYSLYQYSSILDSAGSNGLLVNGESKDDTVTCTSDATSCTSESPSATGRVFADQHGFITFTFERKALHVALSGIDIVEVPQHTVSWKFGYRDEKNFARNSIHDHYLDQYTASLSGWTHTRDYHKGFMRNHNGDRWSNANAIVKGLKPGKLYEYGLYQYSSILGLAGSNGLLVNGESKDDTVTCTSDATSCTSESPSATGQVLADNRGFITFTFERKALHVALSGIDIAEVVGA